MSFIVLLLFAIVALIVAFVLSVVAISQSGEARRLIREINRRIDALDQRLENRRAGEAPPNISTEPAPPPPQPDATSPKQAPPISPPEFEEVRSAPLEAARTDASMSTRLEPNAAGGQQPASSHGQKPESPSFEQRLTSRWLVWVGGIALSLGGAFLVKLAADHGWFLPSVRIASGLVLAAVLLASGEWLMRRLRKQSGETYLNSTLQYLPAALTAGGGVTAFGTIFSAHRLYDLIGPLPAFFVLAIIALSVIAFSLRHGMFMALLGLAGGFLVPLLITTSSSNPWSLLAYLSIVSTAGCLLTWYRRQWQWVMLLNLVGAAFWTGTWLNFGADEARGIPIGLYILLVSGLFLHFRVEEREGSRSYVWLKWLAFPRHQANRISFTAGGLAAAGMFALVVTRDYSLSSLVLLGLHCLHAIVVARREPSFDGLPWISASLVLAAILCWQFPEFIPAESGSSVTRINPYPLYACGGFAALFGGAGFVALWGARRPGLWAALSASVIAAIFLVAYVKITSIERSLLWGGGALALAVVLMAAVTAVSRYRTSPGMKEALAAYAVSVVAAVTMAIAVSLFQAWITVALALQVLAISWIHRHLRVAALKVPVVLLVSVVAVRLLFNPGLADYSMGQTPVINWLLYGYGVPIVCFVLAARLFADAPTANLRMLLEGVALALAVVFVSLEIRSVVIPEQRIFAASYSLMERGLQSIAWLAAALGLFRLSRSYSSPVVVYGWQILLWLGIGNATIFGVLLSLPVFSVALDGPLFVGKWPLFNILALVYGMPALLCAALFAMLRPREELRAWAQLVGAISLLLAFVWISYEVQRAFQSGYLWRGPTSDAEWYTYSAVWLLCGLGLLALAIWRESSSLRHASLIFVIVSVLKVFLFDMSALTGLYRALSFIGLGLCLIAVGYFFQVFVYGKSRKHDPGLDEKSSPG